MARSQNQRLRRMAEKAARRKEVVAQKRRAEAAAAAVSESLQILDAAKAPNFACFATEALFDVGMGWVVAARYLPTRMLAIFIGFTQCFGMAGAAFGAKPVQMAIDPTGSLHVAWQAVWIAFACAGMILCWARAPARRSSGAGRTRCGSSR